VLIHGLTRVEHPTLDVVYSLSPVVDFVLKSPVDTRAPEKETQNRIIGLRLFDRERASKARMRLA